MVTNGVGSNLLTHCFNCQFVTTISHIKTTQRLDCVSNCKSVNENNCYLSRNIRK